MMNAYFAAMRNYGKFSGRTTRKQFWFYLLTLMVLIFVALMLDIAIGSETSGQRSRGLLTGFTFYAHTIPTLAVQVRRLHDVGRSGWLVLISMIPLVGFVLLYFYCQSSVQDTAPSTFPGPLPSSAVPAAPPAVPIPLSDKLAKLIGLRESGALSDAEFRKMKSQLLNSET